MPDESIQTINLPIANALNTFGSNDFLIALANTGSVTNTVIVNLKNVMANSSFDLKVTGNTIVSNVYVPVNATSNGITGQIS